MSYDYETYKRCHFTCVYCGFDGRPFDAWRQLTIDHVRPTSCDGIDDPENKVVACHSCNCITAKMKFSPELTREQILEQKRLAVAASRNRQYEEWHKTVAPYYLDRPVLDKATFPSL